MTDLLIELLDRQHRYLTKLEGEEFLRELSRFCEFLDSDPRLSDLVGDQIHEASQAFEAASAADEELILVLREIRQRLAADFPEVDDSDRSPPDPRATAATLDYDSTLAWFDRILDGEAHERGTLLEPTGKEDHSRSATLLRILRGKQDQLKQGAAGARILADDAQRAKLVDITRELRNAGERRRHAHQSFLNARETLAGIAQHRLRHLVAALNPEPRIQEPDDDFAPAWRASVQEWVWGVPSIAREALYGTPGSQDAAKLRGIVDGYRRIVERVYEDVRRRLGLTRSALALIHRFRARCEWYDRERLALLVRARKGRAEDALIDELARWMFDQGLNPLTRARVGGLEPDVLDSARAQRVYLEGKRYGVGRSARRMICRGFAQMCDTIGRLRGTSYEVREAFFMVFREGGPRYLLPSVVSVEACKVYPVLIDIGDPRQTGSRQRDQPIEIIETDLLKGRQPGSL